MSERRDRILQLLRTSPEPRSIASMADELGVHPNTVRFHLDALLRAGRVEQVDSETVGPGRPPSLFQARRGMDPVGPTNYRLLARILASHFSATTPDPTTAAADLGREWGTSLIQHSSARAATKTQSVTELTYVLADLGFKPEPPNGRRAKEIRLRHCPFYEVVQTQGDMICALHLGLMQGALSSTRGPVTVNRLDPLVEPDLCVAHLHSISSGGGASR